MFEILVEGETVLTALSIVMPQILGVYGEPHTWRIHKLAYPETCQQVSALIILTGHFLA